MVEMVITAQSERRSRLCEAVGSSWQDVVSGFSITDDNAVAQQLVPFVGNPAPFVRVDLSELTK